jgi:hypothetical protein
MLRHIVVVRTVDSMRIAGRHLTLSRSALRNGLGRGVVGLVACAILGCGTADGLTSPIVPSFPKPPPAPPSVERYGSVVVTTKTSGSNLDPDGYVVRTDGYWDYSASPTPIAVNGTVTIRGIAAGGHSMSLDNVAPNCHDASLEDRPIRVVAEAVIQVVFEVVCKGN